jgi:DNA-binding CsgD family transcriptional regulator
VAVDPATLRPLRGGPLLERDGELASLDALIDGVAGGEARLALVEAPAGIGKTRLVAEARRRGREAGLRVLAARGGELEREFPFGVVRQLFEPVVMDPKQRKSALAGAAATAAAVFESLEQPESGEEEMGDAAFAVLHGLYWLTANVSADTPLLLAVDDLHWCDRPSLRFLAYLARRLEGLQVLVMGTMRPSEPGADAALLAELSGDPLAVSLHPGALSVEAVTRLVRDRLSEDAHDAFAAACHAATGGNPLLLQELLKSVEAEHIVPDAAHADSVREVGPKAVSRAVVVRLARLPEDAVSVARAVAVLGDGAELGAVAALTGLDEESAARATSDLAKAEVLRPEPPLGFVHPLVRAAVYQDISPGERELQHERAAQILSHAEVQPERVAAHLLVIPPGGEAEVASVLQEAGRAAVHKGAAESAVAYLERALAEPPAPSSRASVLFELGLAELLTSGPAAVEHLREAYDKLEHPAQRGMAGYLVARVLPFTGAPAEGLAMAQRVIQDLPPELDDLRNACEAIQMVAAVFGGGPRDVVDVTSYRTESPGEGPGAKFLQSIAAYDWMVGGGSADDCAKLALEALEGGTLLAADEGLFSVIAEIVLAVADRQEAFEAFETHIADAHRRGSLFGALGVHLWQGYAHLRWGELPEAEQLLKVAVEEAELWGSGTRGSTVAGYENAFLASTQVERGDVQGARQTLERQGPLGDGADDATNFMRWSTMEVLLAEGRAEEALAVGEQYEQTAAHVLCPGWAAWRSLKAEALDRLGRRDEAVALAEEELELSRSWGAPGTVGRTLVSLGTLKRDEGREHLEEAVEVLEGSSAKLAHAKALAALGAALRHGRKPTEAREPLKRALELADACGSPPLAERARSELYAAGARPRTTALSGVEALTASEKRVAGLAAEGQTNRDIAQNLFVTPKTVEVHLSNAYRKLGIRSRRELSGVLATP